MKYNITEKTKLISRFILIYKKLELHIRGVEITFPVQVGDDEIEKVIDGLGFGMGLTEFYRHTEFKELRKMYYPPNGNEVLSERSIDIEFIKSEYGNEKKVLIYVRSYENEQTGEHTVESLLQTVVTNLQEGFGADIKTIRRLENKELPSLNKKLVFFRLLARFFYPLLWIAGIIFLVPLFLRLFTLLRDFLF